MVHEIDEINFDDMGDLALPDHIEWNHDQTDEFTMDVLDYIYG
jgi:hypothetical protein